MLVLAAQAQSIAQPPPMHNLLGEPPPPPPRLVAGLRSTLTGVLGCNAACLERAEDWFEQAGKWGAHSVQSMVRLGLTDSFVGALALDDIGSREVRHRLSMVPTTLQPEHSEL